MGQRYGLLPSEVMSRATSWDMDVLDIALTYERYKHNKANGVMPEIRQDVLEEALKKVRGP